MFWNFLRNLFFIFLIATQRNNNMRNPIAKKPEIFIKLMYIVKLILGVTKISFSFNELHESSSFLDLSVSEIKHMHSKQKLQQERR